VESVAWAAERKDVLSTLFFLLSLWSYTRYAERPGTWRYLGIVLFFGMSLMSKPMGVTFPFVLLLLDWWPFCRMKGSSPEGGTAKFPVAPWRQLFLEKTPLILMAAGSAAVTLNFGGTPWTVPLETFPLGVRLTNAVVSYATYLWKFVYPSSLAVFYPHPVTLHAEIPAWEITGAALLLSGITFLSLREARVRPFLAMGWFFYLGTLIPVIGLVQVGAQAMADRFTYVPLIGVFVAIAWGFPETAKRLRIPHLVSAGTRIAMIMALAGVAWNQVGYWRNSVTLFSRALTVTNSNWLACNNLGTALEDSNRFTQAIPYFQEAIRIKPDYALAWNNLGEAYLETGQFQKAVSYHWEAIRLQPNSPTAWNNLGAALLQLGQTRQAIEYSMQAARIKPDAYEAWNNLGLGYDKLGQVGKAFSYYRKALQLNPEYPNAWYNMGLLHARMNQFSEAVACFKEVVRHRPDFAEAWNNLGAANMQLGQYQEAIGCYREALRLKPDFASAWMNMGTAYEKVGNQRDAEACFQEARRLNTK
jgi:tetratricopeptide (TPR) repeat protein